MKRPAWIGSACGVEKDMVAGTWTGAVCEVKKDRVAGTGIGAVAGRRGGSAL